MNNLHVSFTYNGTSCHFDLMDSQTSNDTVKINGINYSIVAAHENSEVAHRVLNAINAKDSSIAKSLDERLKSLQGITDVNITPIQKISRQILQPQQTWKQTEEANVRTMANDLAKSIWKNKDRMDLSGLKGLLNKANFDAALDAPTSEAFLALFGDLSVNELWMIRNNENFHPVGFVKTEPYIITPQDRQNLKEYLDDIGFSGVVTLSDAKGTYSICPTGKESLENVPFCMHSITKVFTGVLALMAFPSPDKSHIELATTLDEPLQSHLSIPTLLQAMTHNAGFGDYLTKYETAVKEALSSGKEPPVISKPEDFLTYADTTLYPLNNGRYSNLGILLVGLAVQHKNGDRPFNEILQELILEPAKIRITDTKPQGAKFNATDPCQGNVVGSPAGGYWTTTGDLLKFGNWLQTKCKDPAFLALIENYGTEFYVKDDNELRHNGCSASGSSFLSSFKESGVTIAILSDQSDFMANRIYYTIREKLIEQQS